MVDPYNYRRVYRKCGGGLKKMNCPRCNSNNSRTDIETSKARYCTCLTCTHEFIAEKDFTWTKFKNKKVSKKQVQAHLNFLHGGGLFAEEKPKA